MMKSIVTLQYRVQSTIGFYLMKNHYEFTFMKFICAQSVLQKTKFKKKLHYFYNRNTSM